MERECTSPFLFCSRDNCDNCSYYKEVESLTTLSEIKKQERERIIGIIKSCKSVSDEDGERFYMVPVDAIAKLEAEK